MKLGGEKPAGRDSQGRDREHLPAMVDRERDRPVYTHRPKRSLARPVHHRITSGLQDIVREQRQKVIETTRDATSEQAMVTGRL